MKRCTTMAVLAAGVMALSTAANADIPAGKHPGQYKAPPAVQVTCQVNDSNCHRVAAYVLDHITPWLNDRAVITAIDAQNIANAKLTNLEIDKLDIGFIDRTDKALIDSKMHNDLSTFLTKKKEADKAVILEIFIFDQDGLNVGQTDSTQDYYQGDEAKYWKTFMVGPGAIYIDEVGVDDGRNVSQANLTITSPETGKPIGAMTVGVDIDRLPR